jgi:Cdc6-like AAA superfamily ATPase
MARSSPKHRNIPEHTSHFKEDVREIKDGLKRRWDLADSLVSIEKQAKIAQFLSAIRPETTQESNIRLRHPGTGLWFIECDEFQTWVKGSVSRLWIYGIPGSGKSVLTALSIEEVQRALDSRDALAYFFCDYMNATTQDPAIIFGSLAKLLGY